MTFQLPDRIDTRPIAILGAGTLGRRIALMMATRGAEVRLYDPNGMNCGADRRAFFRAAKRNGKKSRRGAGPHSETFAKDEFAAGGVDRW